MKVRLVSVEGSGRVIDALPGAMGVVAYEGTRPWVLAGRNDEFGIQIACLWVSD